MSNRRVGAMAVAAALGVGGGSVAWACTASPSIVSVEPLGGASPGAGANFGAAGSTLTVQGSAVAAGAPVAIRWNATDGSVIGVGAASPTGKFALAASVPAAAPGVYYLVAEVGGVGVARSPFEVTGAGAVAPAASVWAPSPVASPTGSSPAGVVGLGLLGVGVVGLFGGVAVATLGRRPGRATVR